MPTEIVFDEPVRIRPGQLRALYIHSALPDDLGIQYQSYRSNDVIAQVGHATHLQDERLSGSL